MEARFVDVHTHKEGRVVILAQSEMPCAGVHPWDCASDNDLSSLESSDIVAIGEIGLDYAKEIDKDCQQKLFERQLEIAQRRNLPVVIHCVRAYNETLATLGRYVLPAIIFHSFIGSPELAAQITAKGYYISFSPMSLKSPKTRSALLKIDQKRLLLESDTSSVAISELYGQVAVLLGIKTGGLKELVFRNFKDIFG